MIELSYEMMNVIVGLVIIVIVGRSIYLNVAMLFAKRSVVKKPTEENALKIYKLLNAKFGVTINNHPKDWGEYRDMFYKINGSSEIPTELKEKIKARLVKKGLYINNMKVVDNYKEANFQNDTSMQDEMMRQQNEWAMEESRKAVTPFDHGGYVQGDGFNPSDTMAADA